MNKFNFYNIQNMQQYVKIRMVYFFVNFPICNNYNSGIPSTCHIRNIRKYSLRFIYDDCFLAEQKLIGTQ